jgi:hypothetical protein
MDSDPNNKRDSLLDIKAEALLLQNNMSSHLIGEALYAQMEYDRLVERFYTDHRDMCRPEDFEAARQDFDAFIRLLDAAIAHYS